MWREVCMNMCMAVFLDMYIDLCMDMCTDMSADTCTKAYASIVCIGSIVSYADLGGRSTYCQ